MGNLVKRSVLILIFLQGLPVFGAQRNTFTVVRVIDGDTCILQNGERVRYYGINAPESGDSAVRAVTLRTCLGKNTQSELFWGSRSPIWNNDADTIFIRDSKGQLILSYIY